jgi:3D (Asp-Asp-Asp) domain-containing protein/LysM repeat protein
MEGKRMLRKLVSIITIIVLSLLSANVEARTIEVKKGDTLWEISQVHRTTVLKLKEWNDLPTDIIHPGDVLTVSPEVSYAVKDGDTLWAIAAAHHVTVSQLMERNSLSSDLIHPGLTLFIPNCSTTTVHANSKNQRHLAKVSASHSKAVAAVKTKRAVTRVRAASTTIPSSGKVITVSATAYTPYCGGCSGITATGINVKANPNAKVIAVDPSVIPLGSKVYIEGLGVYTAADTGGAIRGHRIDVLMPSNSAALHFGRKHLKITILQ